MSSTSQPQSPVLSRQQIINYEYQILQQQTPQVKPIISTCPKYTPWQLPRKIQQISTKPYEDHTIRWIGNSKTAYLEAYAYIMLVGGGNDEGNTLLLKEAVYKVGRQCLGVKEQKLLVQFLCLIQYSRDRYSFLNKYPQIEEILIMILQYIENEQPNSQQEGSTARKKAKIRRKASGKLKHPDQLLVQQSSNKGSQQFQIEMQLQQIYRSFNSYFKFITTMGSNEYSCTLKLFEQKTIYIIIEKQCYFMVEPIMKSKISSSMGYSSKRSVFIDFDKVMNEHSVEQEEEDLSPKIVVQNAKGRRNQYVVEESSVIPVERQSQIRKPTDQELNQTPRAGGFGKLSPPKERKKGHDSTFIDQLVCATPPSREVQNGNFTDIISKNKTNQKKEKMKQRSKEIQALKDGLQSVRQRLERKIKVIEDVKNFKHQAEQRHHQQHREQSVESSWKTQKSILVRQPSVQDFHRKDRKISYNEPTAFQRKRMQQQKKAAQRGSRYPMATIQQRVFSQKAGSRPLTKVNSTQSGFHPQAHLTPSGKTEDVDASAGKANPRNVNVNVNVSIHDHTMNDVYSKTAFFKSKDKQESKFPTSSKLLNHSIQFPPSYAKAHHNTHLQLPQSSKKLIQSIDDPENSINMIERTRTN